MKLIYIPNGLMEIDGCLFAKSSKRMWLTSENGTLFSISALDEKAYGKVKEIFVSERNMTNEEIGESRRNIEATPLEIHDLEGMAYLLKKPKKHKVKVRRRKANANPDHA